jgi:hypothetical protein
MLRDLFARLMLRYALLLFLLPAYSSAQDSNFIYTIDDIERRLVHEDFEIFRFKYLRFEGDIGKRVILKYPDVKYVQVKWRRARKGGHEFNNAPRYEIAAYQIQKLFLAENEFVVPPTLCRGFPMVEYKAIEPDAGPTFNKPDMVLVLLQYWLDEVTTDDVYDKKRFENDSLYAKHFANTNILTYLIYHSDSNEGNLLISTDKSNPRVFSVDNGIAFMSKRESERGTRWRSILVKKLPRKTIARLREITPEALHKALGVVAQLEIKNGMIKPAPPTENINVKKGVRRNGNIIQLGLTAAEINAVDKRLKDLLKNVDKGKYKLF